MARGTWNIEYKSGASYVSDGTIYRPNETLQLNLTSTATKIRLANGSSAFIVPETKSNKEAIQLVWMELDYSDGLITKINGYITSGNYVRITTHQSEQLIGRFINSSRVWISGLNPEKMDFQAILERIE